MSTPSLPGRVETVVIGAGHAGLSTSALLQQAGRPHVVLERRARLGGGWLDRWDAFRLVSPNWTTSFVGFEYDGPDPDGFMTRDDVVDRIARYAAHIEAPVITDTRVERLERNGARAFRLLTTRGTVVADRVIVATGPFQVPSIPTSSAGLAPGVVQLHSHAYRNPEILPDGAVVIVGSGQTGVQLAEELHVAGRRVFLSLGSCGWVPRRYRGRDFFDWLWRVRMDGDRYGIRLRTIADLKNPRGRFDCNPALSGHGGGHSTEFRRLGADGITLLGRFARAAGPRLRFEGDLRDRLAATDRFFDERWRPIFDRYIDAAALDAPVEERQPIAFEPPERTEIDADREGISTVIWASGYRLDFGWIDLPIFDALGVPRQVEGLTEIPGLAFIGLPWQRDQGSATLFGARRDAPALVERLLAET